MRFIQFAFKEAHRSTLLPRLGVMKTDSIITDVSTLLQEAPTLVSALRNLGPDTLKQKTSELLNKSDYDVPLDDIDLLAPVTSPDKVACVGMNYKDHCEEQGSPVPKEPVFFNKFPSCIIGPYDAIPYPSVSEQLDWEVELAIVIGRKGKNIDVNSAYDYIFGYTVAHDVSARDWQLQKNGGQWFLGKTMDGFCPLGPCVVTSDDIKDPHDLKISCRVNGETKQNSSTNQMVHRCDAVVSFLSKFCTLLPGDVILTGTPPGVGVFAKPPQFLKTGDVVECEIEQIGLIRNCVA